MVAILEVLSDEETPRIDMETLLELGTNRQIESLGDVKLETELNNCQNRQLLVLLKGHNKVFLMCR